MALTGENVKQAIFDLVGFDSDRWYRPDWHGIAETFTPPQAVIIDGDPYVIKTEDSEFAGEGDYNAEVYVVFVVYNQSNTMHFRISGWYQSYEGTDWETNLYEVKPREVKVVKWEVA